MVTTTEHQILCRRPTFLDNLVVFLLVFLAAVPFGKVLYLHLGFAIVSLEEILLLAVFFLFMAIVAARGLILIYAPYVAFVLVVFFCYLAFSLMTVDTPQSQVGAQFRNYLPFIVACAALVTRLHIDKDMFLRSLTVAVAISALLAILVHLFFQEFILNALSVNEEMAMIIAEGGRMYWGSATLAFFALASLFLLDKGRAMLVISVIVILVGVLFTQSRTVLAGVLLFLLLCQLFVSGINPSRVIGAVVLSIVSVGIFMWFASPQMVGLLLRRLFLGGNAQAELARSLTQGRLPLYEQYAYIFADTFPVGQGLGRPLGFNYYLERPVFTSDISLVSFSLPFGILGLAMLCLFILICRKSFSYFERIHPKTRNAKVFGIMLIVAFMVSLNLDLFSQNAFVVYLAVFAMIHFVSENRQRWVRISSISS